MTKSKQKNLSRKEQRAKTPEIGVIDLVQATKGTLSALLTSIEVPVDIEREVHKINNAKDRELLRLRRALITEQKKNKAIYQNVIPRLRSKAAEVRTLREKLYGKQTKDKNTDKGVFGPITIPSVASTA